MEYNIILRNCVFITAVALCFDIVYAQDASSSEEISSAEQKQTEMTQSSIAEPAVKPDKEPTSEPTETDIATLSMKPAPKPDLPEETKTVKDDNNKTCILIKVSAQICLQNGTKSINIPLPDDVMADGTCDGKDTQEVTLKFKSYEWCITFNKSDDNMWWGIQSMQLSSRTDEADKNDPKAVSKPSKSPVSKNNVFKTTKMDPSLQKIPMNMSYSCNEMQKIDLYDGSRANASIVIDELLVQAFVPDETFGRDFGCGSQIEKITDKPTQPPIFYQSDTVPIAVGSCLAVATVLVIAGYAIYRQLTVKKVEYATMEE